jgi:cytochrome c nitrite reductase small subunit
MVMFERLKSFLSLSGLSRRWRIAIYLSAGICIGMALLLVRIANAASYLSDAPKTCVNCHVMTDAYVAWQRGSHGRVAICTDCHVPHNNFMAKYAFKATDGLKHSYVFTLRKEPQVLQLSNRAVPVVQANCLRCHSDRIEMIRLAASSERKCWDCHNNIHGSVRSLSSSSNLLRPRLPDAGIEFMVIKHELIPTKKGAKP